MSKASEKKSLVDFLLENPVDNLIEEIVVSKRLKDYPFTIKAMTGEEFSKYQAISTALGKKNKVDVDNKKWNELIVLNHVIDEDGKPFFRCIENIKKSGTRTPEEFLYRFINAGEIAEIVKKVTEISGFDEDEEELVKEAKND